MWRVVLVNRGTQRRGFQTGGGERVERECSNETCQEGRQCFPLDGSDLTLLVQEDLVCLAGWFAGVRREDDASPAGAPRRRGGRKATGQECG